MGKVVRFPVAPPEKKGARKVRKRKPDLEDLGQLNLFDQSKIIAFDDKTYFEQALAMDEQGSDEALNLYEQAIINGQSVADSYCNLGIIMSQKDELAKAVDYLTKCLKENPRHFEAHYNLANVYSEKGNLNLARMHYEVAIELEPQFPNSHYNLGLVWISLRDYKKASQYIDKYIELSPDYDLTTANELLKTLNSIAQ